MRGHRNRSRRVDTRQPINWDHPLNRNRVAWLLGVKNWVGTPRVNDLCFKNPGTAVVGVVAGVGTRPGGFGQLTFNGTTNQMVQCGRIINNFSTTTVACWFKIATHATLGQVIFDSRHTSAYNSTFQNGAVLYLGTDGKLHCFNDGTNVDTIGATAGVGGAWHYGMLTVAGTAWKFYLDGLQDASYTANANHSSNYLALGHAPGQVSTVGALDDFSLWQGRALTAAEALQVYRLSRLGYPGMLNFQVPPRRVAVPAAVTRFNGPYVIGQAVPAASSF